MSTVATAPDRARLFAFRVRAAAVRSLESALVRAPRRTGEDAGNIAWLVARMLPTSAARRLLLRRVADVAIAAGAVNFCNGVIAALARRREPDAGLITHELLLRLDRVEQAGKVRLSIEEPVVRNHLQHAEILAEGDASAAYDVLVEADEPDRTTIALGVQAAALLGDPIAVLSRGTTDSSVVTIEQAFDARWDVGDRDGVRDVVRGWSGTTLRSLGRVDRFVRAHTIDGWSTEDVEALILAERVEPADDEWRVELLVHFGRLDEALDLADRRGLRRRGSATTRSALAAATYLQRDFAATRRLTNGLIGTARHWDAEKLEARLLLEEGAALDATLMREGRARLRPAFDDVYYLARLQLGERATAFRDYLHVSDRRRLEATFRGRARADLDATPIDRGDLFVVPQNGPADEIAMAALYPLLDERCASVSAACDPRLARLLGRSFPAVEFVPTERRASRPQFGFLGPDRPPRRGPFFDLLDHHSFELARLASQVVLGRSLIQLTESAHPFAPYIVPDPAAIEAHRARHADPTIGIVWRSEYVTNSRSVHFLSVPELASLTGLDATFLCLQHDVTADERASLRSTFGERVRFVTDIDLRDDLDGAAAVVASCDAVVGVGTTLVELAAATGTTTVCLHPTLLSSWRIQDGGRDYWHATMTGAGVDGPTDRARCVDVAVRQLERSGFRRRS